MRTFPTRSWLFCPEQNHISSNLYSFRNFSHSGPKWTGTYTICSPYDSSGFESGHWTWCPSLTYLCDTTDFYTSESPGSSGYPRSRSTRVCNSQEKYVENVNLYESLTKVWTRAQIMYWTFWSFLTSFTWSPGLSRLPLHLYINCVTSDLPSVDYDFSSTQPLPLLGSSSFTNFTIYLEPLNRPTVFFPGTSCLYSLWEKRFQRHRVVIPSRTMRTMFHPGHRHGGFTSRRTGISSSLVKKILPFTS